MHPMFETFINPKEYDSNIIIKENHCMLLIRVIAEKHHIKEFTKQMEPLHIPEIAQQYYPYINMLFVKHKNKSITYTRCCLPK